jgi:DeoR/GlpR family transcriptional regulator of sugar metabolism
MTAACCTGGEASSSILALDSSKFGQTDFVTVCGLERIDLVVTERTTSEVRDWCAGLGTALLVTAERPRSRSH